MKQPVVYWLVRPLFFVVAWLGTYVAPAQINQRLKAELDSIVYTDQFYRKMLYDSTRRDSLRRAHHLAVDDMDAFLATRIMHTDSSNSRRVEQIISRYGYPGKKLVGTPTNEAVWFVVQHSPAIGRYLPLIEAAGKRKELPFPLVAMMQDRWLTEQHKEQVYGTQLWCEGGECYVWPIRDPRRVNERRRKAGFKTTVEENARQFGITYQVRRLPIRR